jgi:uncharacterized coiled-coil protein SlyX
MITEQTFLDWVIKGFVAVLAWLGVNLHSRVRELEEKTATKVELGSTINDLKDTMKEHREDTRQGFAELRAILLRKPDRDE